jgi:hypothetical protein
MEDSFLEILAKKAYEEHVGLPIRKDPDRYFTIDVYTWAELPASTKLHWKKIVKCVIDAFVLENCDCGDLG